MNRHILSKALERRQVNVVDCFDQAFAVAIADFHSDIELLQIGEGLIDLFDAVADRSEARHDRADR